MFQSLRSAVARMLGNPPQALPPAPSAPPLAVSASMHAPDDVALAPLPQPEPEPGHESPPDAGQLVLSRNEVLDADLRVVGYEFALRADLRAKVRTRSRGVRDFLDGMLLDQLAQVSSGVLASRRPWVQMWEGGIQRNLVGRLPPKSCILLVPDRPDQGAAAITRERVQTLRGAGHEVWLDDCAMSPWFASLVDAVDGCTVRMALRAPFEITGALERVRKAHRSLRCAAWEVGTFEEQALVKKLGCNLFSGGFVTYRGDFSANKLSPQVVQVAMLINQLRQDADMREIARILKQDMAMSYRMLRYVNTTAHGLNHAVSSIEQGLMVMGEAQLDRWLTLLLLTGGAGGGSALTEISLTRARFLELLGEGRMTEEQCERLFVLGLFSMLDVALQVPLQEALRPLRLPEVMNAALLEHKGPFGAYLALADACERANAEQVIRHAMAIGLSPAKVNARHLEALEWVARTTDAATA